MVSRQSIAGLMVLIAACNAVIADDSYDVVVYGGTSAGVTAAAQVARLGKHAVLIEPGKHLGGLSSGGLGWTDLGKSEVVGGLSRDFYHRVWLHYQKDDAWKVGTREKFGHASGQGTRAMDNEGQLMWVFEPHVAEKVFDDMAKEAGVTIVFGERLDLKSGVHSNAGRITSIVMESGRTFPAKIFIDASYEGDLMAKAGVKYTVGREANAVYGETIDGIQASKSKGNQLTKGIDPYMVKGDKNSGLLPGVNPDAGGADGAGDNKVQAYCYRMCLTDVPENRVAVEKPSEYKEADYELLFRAVELGKKGGFYKLDLMPNRKTDSNNSGGISLDYIGMNYSYPDADYAAREQIARSHENWQRGLVWTLQHSPRVPEEIRKKWGPWGLPADEFADTGHWARQLYVREARRMLGSFVETEHTLRHDSEVAHSIGMGSYTMDSHNVQRYVDSDGLVRNEGDVQIGVPHPYRIDYGAIVPKAAECQNLLVPVCLSASHIAYGSIRMEPVFMILGQSAGTAAAIAIDEQGTVQKVPYEKLHERLIADKQVLEWTDPKKAAATAP